MKIDHEFTVSVPVDRAWAVLTDLEAIAPCMPGAQLTGVDGDVYSGTVKIKVGPVVSQYAGNVKFLEKDDAGHRAVIDARGRDSRGGGNASAVVTAQLHPDGDRTRVTVETDLKITGRIAQFGSGMIKEVSNKLLGQFVANLENRLLADGGAAQADATPAEETAAKDGQATDTAVSGTAEKAAQQTAKETGEGAAEAATAAPAEAAKDAAAADAKEKAAEPAAARSEAAGTAASGTAASGTAASGTAAKPADAGTGASGTRPAAQAEEAEPLDVLSLAGTSIYKRLVPLAVALVVIIAVIVVLVVS
jgi:carbon monoxide dehydrogenase subunit G